MEALILARRALRLDERQWARVDPMSLWAATAVAGGASAVLALTRVGGLVATSPRGFLRLALVGVWGWVGLAFAIWLLLGAPRARLETTMAAVGLAHTPVLVLGVVIFAAANLFELLGPGRVVAWFVFAFWFPATLTMAARGAGRLPLVRAIAVIAAPYAIWLALAGRLLLQRVSHLL